MDELTEDQKEKYVDLVMKKMNRYDILQQGFSESEIDLLDLDSDVNKSISDSKLAIQEEKFKKDRLQTAKKISELQFVVDNQEEFYDEVLKIIRDDRKEALGAKASLLRAFMSGQIAYLAAYGRNQATKDQDMNKQARSSSESSYQEFKEDVTTYDG